MQQKGTPSIIANGCQTSVRTQNSEPSRLNQFDAAVATVIVGGDDVPGDILEEMHTRSRFEKSLKHYTAQKKGEGPKT